MLVSDILLHPVQTQFGIKILVSCGYADAAVHTTYPCHVLVQRAVVEYHVNGDQLAAEMLEI
jgi:hypothetical protein